MSDLKRMPFLDEAAQKINNMGVEIADIADDYDHPARKRAIHRVKSAITNGTNGFDDWDGKQTEDVELISYPLARLLISMLNDEIATKRFIHAEAQSARTYFQHLENQQNHADAETETGAAIKEFLEGAGYGDAISYEGREDGTPTYKIDVVNYLNITAGQGYEWGLISQGASNGSVTVPEGELVDVIRLLAKSEIAEGLPYSNVPSQIEMSLAAEKAALSTYIQDLNRADVRQIDAVDLDSFPDAISALVDEATADFSSFSNRKRYSVIMFLASCGASPEEASDLLDLDGVIAEYVEKQVRNLNDGDGHSFLRAPSYGALEQMGLIEEDETRAHDTPLVEYKDAL